MKVPFLDLRLQYDNLRVEIGEAIQEVLESAAYSGGPFVERFERDFAAYCQRHHAVGVGSGTEALWLTMLALGVGHGDEVITVPNTFIATAEAISYCGATPVFVDINPQTYTMDPDLIAKTITPRTKAIIPVHLFGQPADMDPIVDIANEHGLRVIEDACQAHGAEYKGRKVGSIGHAGCFSFYPSKNLGAFGEAGAVVTNSADLDRTLRLLRDHGQSAKYRHDLIGWNARMDGIQGAILSVKLRYLEEWIKLRRQVATVYAGKMGQLRGITIPSEADYSKHVFHIYAVRVAERDRVIDMLRKRDVHCGIHYPVPIHLQNAYRSNMDLTRYPVAERSCEELLSLPMFPELTQEQMLHVVHSLTEVLQAPRVNVLDS